MPKPKCPECDSTNVVPSLAKNSHNNCVACGYSGFVRAFYPEELEHHLPGDRVKTNGRSGKVPEPVGGAEGPARKRYWWQDQP